MPDPLTPEMERGPFCIYCGTENCQRDHTYNPALGPPAVPNYYSCCGHVKLAHGAISGHKRDCKMLAAKSTPPLTPEMERRLEGYASGHAHPGLIPMQEAVRGVLYELQRLREAEAGAAAMREAIILMDAEIHAHPHDRACRPYKAARDKALASDAGRSLLQRLADAEAKVDGLECTLDDEETAHQETLSLWKQSEDLARTLAAACKLAVSTLEHSLKWTTEGSRLRQEESAAIAEICAALALAEERGIA